MAAKKKNVISKASPHTIKKFELIEEYIKSWAQKLLLTESCNGLIFIDCMCNSGVYTDDAGQLVKGTAVRVSEALREASRSYTEKNIHIYLNDKDKARVDELKKHLPQDERNFKIVTSTRRVLGRYLAHSHLPSTRLRTGSCHLTFSVRLLKRKMKAACMLSI